MTDEQIIHLTPDDHENRFFLVPWRSRKYYGMHSKAISI